MKNQAFKSFIIFVCLFHATQLHSQDSIVLKKFQDNYLSEFIKFDKLKNVKCIKQTENYNVHRALDLIEIIIDFSKNSVIEKYSMKYRDGFECIFTNYQDEFNNLDITKMEIFDLYSYSGYLKNRTKDTSYHYQKIIWKKDTIMNIYFDVSPFASNFNDTAFWIYDNKNLIKEIYNSYWVRIGYQDSTKHFSQEVTEYFYNEFGNINKTILNAKKVEYIKYGANVIKNNIPDTIFIEYKKSGDELLQIESSKEGQYITSFKYSGFQNRTLTINYYYTEIENKVKHHIGQSLICYNENGLPVKQKKYYYSHFLGIEIKEIILKRTFEYTYY